MRTVAGDPEPLLEPDTADEAGTAPADRRFRPDVEGLRAVAVLLVVLYHGALPGLHGGYVGVDVFFVISGFVITGLLLRERADTERTSLASFYGRRIRRILPAATLVIVATVIATYAVLGVVVGDPTAVAARWTAVFLANLHFAAIGTDYLTARQPPSPLQNFWSLAVEEQFYLVYPAIFLLAASLRSTVSLRARLVVLLVPVILVSLLVSVVQTGTSPTTAFFSPVTRAWELALGALVAVLTPTFLRAPARIAAACTWVGLAAVGVAAVTYTSTTPYPGVAVALPVVGTALVIAGGTPVPRGGAESVLRLRPFQWFGRLSYSLYLWHWPILIIAAEYAGRSSLPFHRAVGWLALALVAAYVTQLVVENPVRHARVLARSRPLTLLVGVGLVATSLTVALVAPWIADPPAPGGAADATVASLPPAELLKLVAAAPSITSLPAGLTPSLTGVHADWGGPPPRCWPTSGESTIPACVFGDRTSGRTMVLYGDSHAAMWFDVVNLIAALSHWRLLILAKGDCPALDLTFQNPPGYGSPTGPFTACSRWHTFALDRMRAAHPDLIVITQDADFAPGGLRFAPPLWQTATEATVRALPVPADRVVILGNIPQTPQGGPQCLALHPNDVQQCSGPNSPYTERRNRAERAAAAATGARYVDTVPWFCSHTCTDVIGHYQPYWDDYHVNATYSLVLGQVLADSIDLPSYPPLRTATPAPTPTTGTG